MIFKLDTDTNKKFYDITSIIKTTDIYCYQLTLNSPKVFQFSFITWPISLAANG